MNPQATDSPYVQDERDIEETLQGNSDSFGKLVARHFRLAFSIALAAVGEKEAAEEVTQEAFARAYLNLNQLREKRTFAAWLGGICRNIGHDWVRKGQRRSKVLPLITLDEIPPNTTPSPQPSVRETLARAEEHQLLSEAILRLHADLREIVLLHYSHELSKSDIARLLNLHPSTVGRHLDRAHAELRRELEPALKAAAKSLEPAPASLKRTLAFITALGLLSRTEQLAVAKALGVTSVPLAPAALPSGSALAAGAKTALVGALLLLGTAWTYRLMNPPSSSAPSAALRSRSGSPAAASGSLSSRPPSRPHPSAGDASPQITRTASLSAANPARPSSPAPNPTASADAATSTTIPVAGRVVTPDGAPLPGASITVVTPDQVHTPPSPSASTDATGWFEVRSAPNTLIGLKTQLEGYTDGYADNIQVRSAPIHDVMIVTGALGDATGIVTDPLGHPVENAEITVQEEFEFLDQNYGSGYSVARTDAQGQFRLEKLPTRKELVLNAQMSGYAAAPPLQLQLAAGETKSGIRLLLRAPHWLGGRVTDAHGAPVSGVSLAAIKPGEPDAPVISSRTDADGRYRLEQLPEGPLRVTAATNSIPPQVLENVSVDRDDADFVIGKQDPAKGRLIGKVIAAHDRSLSPPTPSPEVSTGRKRTKPTPAASTQ